VEALEIDTRIAGWRSSLDAVKGSVSETIGRVRAEGDDALLDPTRRFNGIDLEEIAVTDAEKEGPTT